LHRTLPLLGCLALSACGDQAAKLVPIPRLMDSGPVDAGPACNLGVAPASLDFGNMLVGSNATDRVTLWNDGGARCDVSGVALAAGTDPYFSLPASQPTAFSIEPGASTGVAVTFTAAADVLPYLRVGTLTLVTGDPSNPTAAVPLSAYINSNCTPASQLIYTVDLNGMFSAFHPDTLTFVDIGVLSCPTSGGNPSSPYDMTIDQHGVAWVLYGDGELFRVETASAVCAATSFQIGQQGFVTFGMGSVFDLATGQDTLYITGIGISPQALGTISFPDLTVSVVGPLSIGSADPTGTGDGELWAFVPSQLSPTNVATLAQIDPSTAAILSSTQYPTLSQSRPTSWAMKFYGGYFWVFLGSAVYAVDRATLTPTIAIPEGNGRNIVGAGVSTCAPVQ
jgi:hypothetical protein